MTVTTLMWICMALVVVLGIPFILLWWRDMDRWADAEHRRFAPPAQRDTQRPTIVLRDEPVDDLHQEHGSETKGPPGRTEG